MQTAERYASMRIDHDMPAKDPRVGPDFREDTVINWREGRLPALIVSTGCEPADYLQCEQKSGREGAYCGTNDTR